MSQKTRNFLELATDDYITARFLLRNGLLPQGTALAATAVEKHFKAILALRGTHTKKHLDSGLLALIRRHDAKLGADLNEDFIKFLGRAYQLRYASVDGVGFNIVLSQHRTLIELDTTMLKIDSGFTLKAGEKRVDTPLQTQIKAKNPMVLEDNVPLGVVLLKDIANRKNKMMEIRVGPKLATLTVKYETEGLNIVGDFCKATDIDYGKATWQLARG